MTKTLLNAVAVVALSSNMLAAQGTDVPLQATPNDIIKVPDVSTGLVDEFRTWLNDLSKSLPTKSQTLEDYIKICSDFANSSFAGAADWSATDAIEAYNRAMFEVNGRIRSSLDTLTDAYANVPSPEIDSSLKEALANFANNLGEPVTATSAVAMGDLETAGSALNRFSINLVSGFGGFQDPASEQGFEKLTRDFSDVLCHYGVGAGPYIEFPFLGGSTLRDAVGAMLEFASARALLGSTHIYYAIVRHSNIDGSSKTLVEETYDSTRTTKLADDLADCSTLRKASTDAQTAASK